MRTRFKNFSSSYLGNIGSELLRILLDGRSRYDMSVNNCILTNRIKLRMMLMTKRQLLPEFYAELVSQRVNKKVGLPPH